MIYATERSVNHKCEFNCEPQRGEAILDCFAEFTLKRSEVLAMTSLDINGDPMAFLKVGYLQDGLKAIIYLIPIIYIIIKKEKLRLKYFGLLFLGLSLLFFGHLIDFFDEFASLNDVFIIGNNWPLHDFFEDTIGFTFGFLILIVAIYLELKGKK